MLNERTAQASAYAGEQPDEQRFFQALSSDLEITHGAVRASIDAMRETMKRLGIDSMYGAAAVGSAAEPRGQLDLALLGARSLQDDARELRGLCETLQVKL